MDAPPQVLVVDDERTAREILVLTFSLAGFSVESVEGGDDALLAVERLEPEVVVTDLHMPRMDGGELTDRLAERYGSQGPRIVMATGDSRGAIELRRDDRFFAVLIKPLDPAVLIRTVREAADARRCA
jgi:CheY-like chemotaxis protein